MKKLSVFCVLFILSEILIFGYFKLQDYQTKNWNHFFESKKFDLFSNTHLDYAFKFFDKLYLDATPPQIAKNNICFYQDEVFKNNRFLNVFNHKKLKQKFNEECEKQKIIDENNVAYYRNLWHLCSKKNNCSLILLSLDDYSILESKKVVEIKNNKLTHLDYNNFFKEILHINNPENIVFLAFNGAGTGNQLFQYWSAVVYAQKNNKELILLQNRPIHQIFDNLLSSREPFLSMKPVFRFCVSNRNISEEKDQLIISQNPINRKNLEGFEDYIREKSRFKTPLIDKSKFISEKMQTEESVAIHIRRGDFTAEEIPFLPLSYYKNAINYIIKNVKNPYFYIFSDDILWAKDNLKIEHPHTFVNWNKKDYEDLQLMTFAKHHIIANSSFSWWGAFLKKDRTGVTIVPSTGFYSEDNPTRIQLPGWIAVDVK